eukprot:5895346-Amphidinium_carterae.1
MPVEILTTPKSVAKHGLNMLQGHVAHLPQENLQLDLGNCCGLGSCHHALSPHQVAHVEFGSWSKVLSKLWQPGEVDFQKPVAPPSSWSMEHRRLAQHHHKNCLSGKACGVDRWSLSELCFLPQAALCDLSSLLKTLEST